QVGDGPLPGRHRPTLRPDPAARPRQRQRQRNQTDHPGGTGPARAGSLRPARSHLTAGESRQKRTLSMNIIESLKAKQTAEQDAAFEAYRDLLHAAAANPAGQLDPADQKKLEKLVVALAFPLERVEADHATVREFLQLTAALADADDVTAARNAA